MENRLGCKTEQDCKENCWIHTMPWHNFFQVALLCHTLFCLSRYLLICNTDRTQSFEDDTADLTGSSTRSLSARSSTLFLFLFLISSYNLFSNKEQTFLKPTHITLNTALIQIKLQHLIQTFICRRLYYLYPMTNKINFYSLISIAYQKNSHPSIALTYILFLGWN